MLLEWTTHFLKKMDDLKKEDKFYDSNLREFVEEKLSEMARNDAMDDEICYFANIMDETKDDDEYWYCIYTLVDLVSTI